MSTIINGGNLDSRGLRDYAGAGWSAWDPSLTLRMTDMVLRMTISYHTAPDGEKGFKMSAFSREVPVGQLLTEEQVLDSMTNRSKKAAVEDLVDLLWKEKLIPNKSDAIERVLEREELITTALGEGVAVPHARLEVGERPVLAFGRHSAGIDFGAADGKPVHMIMLVLWKPEQPGLMNRLFSGLVSKLADEDFRKRVVDAGNARDIARLFADLKVNMQAGLASKCEADMLITLQLLETKRRAGTKGLSSQIELARGELPGSMLSRFDRLLDRHSEALVEVHDGVCGGCNMQLSSSFASEMLRNSETIYVCEKCGRYLIQHGG